MVGASPFSRGRQGGLVQDPEKIILCTTTPVSCVKLNHVHQYQPVGVRGRELNTTFFSQTFRARSGYPAKILGISRQKVCFPWFSKDIPNFLAPTAWRGRPPPHPKIFGPKSLGLGSFFLHEESLLVSFNQAMQDKNERISWQRKGAAKRHPNYVDKFDTPRQPHPWKYPSRGGSV